MRRTGPSARRTAVRASVSLLLACGASLAPRWFDAGAMAAPGSSKAEQITDLPCAGCVVRIPSRPVEGPRPLLVALHGDEGTPGKVLRAWAAAAEEANVILFAPRCPREEGCKTGSYWQWLETSGRDDTWLGAQIDAVSRRFAVDPARVYATGYSGGATYLGWYVPRNPGRFAAIAYVSGGNTHGLPCPVCKVPVRFLIGALDPMIGPYTRPLQRYFEGCEGHEAAWESIPGVTHEGMIDVLQAGRARPLLGWMLEHRAACGDPDAGAPDAEIADAGGAAPSPPTIEGRDAGVERGRVAPGGGAAKVGVSAVPPRRSACACGVVGGGESGGEGDERPANALAWAIAALAFTRRRADGEPRQAP